MILISRLSKFEAARLRPPDRMGVLAQYLLMDSLGTHGTLVHRGASFTFRKRRTCWIYTMMNESEVRNFRNALFLAMQLADEADTE